jgi:8-oxo-dGTP pyrophosphatase MutT (NUDIX family)
MGVKPDDPLFEPVTGKERIFSGGYLNLDRLAIRLPDGREGFREVVHVRNAVAVLPLDGEGNVHLVRQHRAAIGRTILEVPAGVLDDGETLEHCALRECEEETGYRPGKLKKLLTYAHAEGYSDGFITLFLGTQLQNIGALKLDSSEFVEQVAMPFPELLSLVRENKIIDSKPILCTLLCC